MGDVEVDAIVPLGEMATDAVVLLCSADPANPHVLYRPLWFLNEPFALAPSPGARVEYERGSHNIEGELIRPGQQSE